MNLRNRDIEMVLINKLNREFLGYSDMITYAKDVYRQVQKDCYNEFDLIVQDSLYLSDLIRFKIINGIKSKKFEVHLIFYPSGFALRFDEALNYKSALIGRILESLMISEDRRRVWTFLENNVGSTLSSPREKIRGGKSLMKLTILKVSESWKEFSIMLESGIVHSFENWQLNCVLTNLDEFTYVPIISLENLLQEKHADIKTAPCIADLFVLAGVAHLSLIKSNSGKEVQGIKLLRAAKKSTVYGDPSEYEMGKELWLCPSCNVAYPPFFQSYVDSFDECLICGMSQDRILRRKIKDFDPRGEQLLPTFSFLPSQHQFFALYLDEIYEMPFLNAVLSQLDITEEERKLIGVMAAFEKIRANHRIEFSLHERVEQLKKLILKMLDEIGDDQGHLNLHLIFQWAETEEYERSLVIQAIYELVNDVILYEHLDGYIEWCDIEDDREEF